MNKSGWNPSAQKTVIQINSTLDMLQQKSLALWYNTVPPIDEAQHHCQITWNNHVPERANCGKAFTTLDQYLHILETNSYHCLLCDGSILRANFEFEDECLLAQNLLWWPSPYDYGSILEEGYPPVELVKEFYADPLWHKAIKMRSPIRIDFDGQKNTANHPHSHLHIQNEETRLSTNKPICFNKFVDFILRNFYPQFDLTFSKFDFIDYVVPELQNVAYLRSQIIV